MGLQVALQKDEKKIFTSEIGKALFENFGINGAQLKQYEEVFEKTVDKSALVKIINEVGDVYTNTQFQYRKLPTAKQILKAFWNTKSNSNILGVKTCNWCNNTGYVLGLYDYQIKVPIPNKQTPVPIDQIEKIAFECFCEHCSGKDLEDYRVREKRILKYGWSSEQADKFIGDCVKLVL